MKLVPVTADNWRMDGGVAFGVVPKSLWSRKHTADENNTIAITTRCLLIRNEGNNILIDTGLGSKRDARYYAVRYREPDVDVQKGLQSIGLHADDITHIIFTHLHDDHVGAATALDPDGRLYCVFKNAEYYVSESHWQWAIHPNKREIAAYFGDNLQPLLDSGRLHLLNEGEQPFANIELRIYNGHTRGQIIPFIKLKHNTLVYLGDFIPTLSNIPLPYIPSVDIEPLVSLIEKEQFLTEALENNYILMFEHDADNECCTLTMTDKGIMADKVFTINDLQLS